AELTVDRRPQIAEVDLLDRGADITANQFLDALHAAQFALAGATACAMQCNGPHLVSVELPIEKQRQQIRCLTARHGHWSSIQRRTERGRPRKHIAFCEELQAILEFFLELLSGIVQPTHHGTFGAPHYAAYLVIGEAF